MKKTYAVEHQCMRPGCAYLQRIRIPDYTIEEIVRDHKQPARQKMKAARRKLLGKP